MNPPKPSAAPKRRKKTPSGPPPLRDSASEAIGHFLETLDGEPCSELYDLVQHHVIELTARFSVEGLEEVAYRLARTVAQRWRA